jgi:hypothetical protein
VGEGRTFKTAVVLLPLGKLFDEVYQSGIAPACEELGLTVTRLGSEFSTENQLGSVCGEIEKAELVIADLTARNPNVMYQVGYAHGTGKRVLFLARHGEDFPFDRAKHALIVHSGDVSFLKEELVSWISGGGTATQRTETADAPVGDAREKFLATFGDILASHAHEHRGKVYLENPTTFVLVDQDMDLALVQDLARRARELGLRLKLM